MNLALMQSFWLPFFLSSTLVFQGCSLPGMVAPSDGSRTPSPPVSDSQSGGATVARGAHTDNRGGGPLVPAVVGLPPAEGDGVYRIGPHDLLQVKVFNVDELSGAERVSEDGTIVMPLIGGVSVGGLTPRQAEQRIAAILGENYLQDPQVDIFVAEYASQDVTVVGAVKKPGVFPITGRTTLLQMIALAEGVDELANEDEVVIFRGQGTPEPRAYVVSLARIQDGKLPDPVLVGDDRVIVPKSGSAVFLKDVVDTLRGFVHLNPLLY